jgi:hypothetical protein
MIDLHSQFQGLKVLILLALLLLAKTLKAQEATIVKFDALEKILSTR